MALDDPCCQLPSLVSFAADLEVRIGTSDSFEFLDEFLSICENPWRSAATASGACSEQPCVRNCDRHLCRRNHTLGERF